MSKSSSFLPFLIIFLISILTGRSNSKGKGKGKTNTPQTSQTSQTAAAPARRAQAKSKPAVDMIHWRAAREQECAYGEENHRFSHNSERRVAQLDGYLKAGLIDRKEYAQMLERYQRMDREAGLD